MTAMHGFVEVNGARLAYEDVGSGPAVVLLHGFSLDYRMWDAQVAAFARHRRVIRYDLRGFGQSAVPTGEPYAHAADLAALLAYLGIAQAAIIGLSLGGQYAVEFALEYPAMTTALVTVDAILSGFSMSAEWGAAARAIWAPPEAASLAERKALWLDHPLFIPANEQPAVGAALARMIGDYSGWHWFNRNPDRTVRPPAAQQLARIAAPTLAIVGERDLPDFHAIADLLASDIPNARKVVIPHAGHMANMEDPAAVNAAILAFLGTE